MDIRQKILEAAARTYAQHGFRGATTRLIATEAGVNEVSIFRTFGSKDQLFQTLMRERSTVLALAELPDHPGDARTELTDWVQGQLGMMSAHSSFLRKAMSEMEERPDAALTACKGPECAREQLETYVQQLQAANRAAPDADVHTAVSMLMSSLFGDAMCRDVIPEGFPQPATAAAARYVGIFLRAVGYSFSELPS